MNPTPLRLLPLVIAFIWQSPILYAAKYYIVPVSEIGFAEESINELTVSIPRFATTQEQAVRYPDIALQNETAEAYISLPEQDDDNRSWWGRENQSQLQVALQLPDDQPVSGVARLAANGSPAQTAYTFTFDPSQAAETTAEDFEAIRKSYYARLAHSVIPGGKAGVIS